MARLPRLSRVEENGSVVPIIAIGNVVARFDLVLVAGFRGDFLIGFVLNQYFDGSVQQLELTTATQIFNLVCTLAYIFGVMVTALFTVLFLDMWNWLLNKTKKAVGEG